VSDTDDAGTVPVDIRLLEIERTCIGRIRAFAAVEIEVAGIVFAIQDITVVQHRREIGVDLPSFQRDWQRLPTFCLPDELIEPMGRLVLEACREMLAAA
jgi:hypothetical protein